MPAAALIGLHALGGCCHDYAAAVVVKAWRCLWLPCCLLRRLCLHCLAATAQCCAGRRSPISFGRPGWPGPGDSTTCWKAPASCKSSISLKLASSLRRTIGASASGSGRVQREAMPAAPTPGCGRHDTRGDACKLTTIHLCEKLVKVECIAVVVVDQQGSHACCDGTFVPAPCLCL